MDAIKSWFTIDHYWPDKKTYTSGPRGLERQTLTSAVHGKQDVSTLPPKLREEVRARREEITTRLGELVSHGAALSLFEAALYGRLLDIQILLRIKDWNLPSGERYASFDEYITRNKEREVKLAEASEEYERYFNVFGGKFISENYEDVQWWLFYRMLFTMLVDDVLICLVTYSGVAHDYYQQWPIFERSIKYKKIRILRRILDIVPDDKQLWEKLSKQLFWINHRLDVGWLETLGERPEFCDCPKYRALVKTIIKEYRSHEE